MKSQTNIVVKLLFLLLLETSFIRAQLDTLICYDVRSAQTSVLLSQFCDTSTNLDHTQWNYGNSSGCMNLDTQPPSNTFPGSGFTDYSPAHNFFSISNYPARIAVKLFRFVKDSLRQICSGTLVDEDLVLTSSHCLYNFFDTSKVQIFADSILAVPAYDNAMENPEYGSSVSESYFIPKENLPYYMSKDIALIKLREPIGLKTGWAGIAFTSSNAYFQNKVFHKFSYPGTIDDYDSSRVFNGDTMYYNYGRLDLIEDRFIGYNIYGVRGQSGSSLLFTDNVEYLTFGTLSWSVQSRHTLLTRGLYNAFKGVIESVLTHANQDRIQPSGFALMNPYPNPFNPTTTITFSIPERTTVLLRLYDVTGRQVGILQNAMVNAGIHQIFFTGSHLSSGVYFLRMESANFLEVKKVILVK